MTTLDGAATAAPAALRAGPNPTGGGRWSWVPTWTMITTRLMELRRRRGLMIALIVVNIGLPTLFLVVRLVAHAVAPKSYGPAGGYDIYGGLVAGVMYVFGFIVAATVGATAGSSDLTDGMFRHLVVTGRSRLALYLARIPAGLAIIASLVAAGFTIVCVVCVFAAPTQVNYSGVNLPAGMSRAQFLTWSGDHPTEVLCDFPGPSPAQLNCGPGSGPVVERPGAPAAPAAQPSPAALRRLALSNAEADYTDYRKQFLYPSTTLMVQSGLWIELEATIGFLVGLGLASLLGQRTVAVILMIVLEVILTPLFSRVAIPHLINLQRGVVGLATAHLEPSALPVLFAGGNGGGGHGGMRQLVPETHLVAALVITAWVVGWTVIGAWRMITRDA